MTFSSNFQDPVLRSIWEEDFDAAMERFKLMEAPFFSLESRWKNTKIQNMRWKPMQIHLDFGWTTVFCKNWALQTRSDLWDISKGTKMAMAFSRGLKKLDILLLAVFVHIVSEVLFACDLFKTLQSSDRRKTTGAGHRCSAKAVAWVQRCCRLGLPTSKGFKKRAVQTWSGSSSLSVVQP